MTGKMDLAADVETADDARHQIRDQVESKVEADMDAPAEMVVHEEGRPQEDYQQDCLRKLQ